MAARREICENPKKKTGENLVKPIIDTEKKAVNIDEHRWRPLQGFFTFDCNCYLVVVYLALPLPVPVEYGRCTIC